MARSTDLQILEFAATEQRVVVTFDADFHTLLAWRQLQAPSVIRLRDGGDDVACTATILKCLELCQLQLSQGAALTVRSGKVRIHRLPIQIAGP